VYDYIIKTFVKNFFRHPRMDHLQLDRPPPGPDDVPRKSADDHEVMLLPHPGIDFTKPLVQIFYLLKYRQYFILNL
jgi:hypothetical protein